MTQTAIVFVAHGSRAAAANEAHRQQAQLLAQRTGLAVVAGFLELAEPSIPEAITHAVASGAPRVLVLPYFLYPGRHTVEDVPALVAAAAEAHPGTDLRLLDAFGADASVVDLLAAQVASAVGGIAPDGDDV